MTKYDVEKREAAAFAEYQRRSELWAKTIVDAMYEHVSHFMEGQAMKYDVEKLPAFTMKEAAIACAIAVVLKNPEITRRTMFNFFRGE